MNMHNAFYLAVVLSLTFQAATAETKPITAQAERGRQLFLKSPKVACGTCHSMDGVGTAVGPDLTKLASAIGPRPLANTIRMTMTAYVQEFKTSDGNFAGFQKQKQGDEIEVWDLSQTPPVLRKLTSKQIVSMNLTQSWKHPPAAAGFTSQELADLVGFLKWASTGWQKEVKAADIDYEQ